MNANDGREREAGSAPSDTRAAKPISHEFPFESRFVAVDGHRIHYVELGRGNPILFLHGNPTSSYIWRNIIPYAARRGRAIAMDMIGMGKSDKPDLSYRFFDHARFLDGFIDAMELDELTIVAHDWGAALAMHHAVKNPGRIRALVLVEPIYRPLSWKDFPGTWRLGFRLLRTPLIGGFMVYGNNVFVDQMLPMATMRKLSIEEKREYRRPMTQIRNRRSLRRWPLELPIEGRPADVHDAIMAANEWLKTADIPKLLLWAEPGALVGPDDAAWFEENVANITTRKIGPGLHFLQEESPHALGEEIERWLREMHVALLYGC